MKLNIAVNCFIPPQMISFFLGGGIYTEQKKKGILNLVLNYAFFI